MRAPLIPYAWLVILPALLFPREALVSMSPEYVTLEKVVERSSLVVVARPKAGEGGPRRFAVTKTLLARGAEKPARGEIIVHGANDRLWGQIEEARAKGQPVPIPILPAYRSSMSEEDARGDAPRILFLVREERELRYAVEGAYESMAKLPEVRGLLMRK